MATKKKMLQAAAGSATGGGALDITDVFSTYLYEGNGSTQTITNDIDLAGEGGLVWLKGRNNGNSHYLHDSERTITKWLQSQATTAEQTNGPVTSFNSNGFSLGYGQGNGGANSSGDTFASWTFRKAPKFFDVVTYTGTGSKRTVSHNLGSTPGMIVIKRTDGSGSDGDVWHRSLGSDGSVNQYYVQLSTDYVASLTSRFGIYGTDDPNDTTFTVKNQSGVNASGATYVAYLFAHNDGDGEFGPDGDQDIIKCGSVTSNSNGQIPFEDLGFEPQWIITKRTDGTSDWKIHDVMRGWGYNTASANSVAEALRANTSGAESGGSTAYSITPTGFYSNANFGANRSFIYIAIRRGPLAPPESATEVFAIDTQVNQMPPLFDSGFPVDFALTRQASATVNWAVSSRLIQGNQLNTDNTNSETSNPVFAFDFMDGWNSEILSTNPNIYSWMWKRAPGYFDVVAYTGNGTTGRTVSHNLGVAPEMMWVKGRDVVDHWHVYHAATTADNYLRLNDTGSATDSVTVWDDTDPTSSVFTVGNNGGVNGSGDTYIAYLFASLPGISKVGSYTGTGSDQNIDCGFTSGARFVLIKRYSSTSPWSVFDSVRGITSSTTDPYLFLNSTNAEATDSQRDLDPYSSGFKLAGNDTDINASGSSYIFYAIA